MTISKRLVGLLTITAGVISAGCVVGGPVEEAGLELELELRSGGDDRTGPDKLNTNFLGASEDWPLDNLPLQPGGEASVELVEIRANKCRKLDGTPIYTAVSTLPVSPNVNVTVSADGVLGPITVARVDKPWIHCQIAGHDWEGTKWEVRVQVSNAAQQQTLETDLRLVDASIDAHGSTAYLWHVNDDRLLDESTATYVATCDEDLDPTDPALAYHAYLIPALHVDATTGDFSYAAPGATMFMACASGAVGKSIDFGYPPWDHDSDTHELATRMVRADYNGNGQPYTQSGTQLWLQDDLGVWQAAAPATHEIEAGWSVAEGEAICVSQPRLPTMTPLGGHAKPECTPQLMVDADIITWVPMQ
jgi:ADYC domain